MKFKALLAAGAACQPGGMAQDVKIGIAAEAYPPFASPDASGNWVGWEIEIINASVPLPKCSA
jgi:polar amino acid transport system substrate-binding protein